MLNINKSELLYYLEYRDKGYFFDKKSNKTISQFLLKGKKYKIEDLKKDENNYFLLVSEKNNKLFIKFPINLIFLGETLNIGETFLILFLKDKVNLRKI